MLFSKCFLDNSCVPHTFSQGEEIERALALWQPQSPPHKGLAEGTAQGHGGPAGEEPRAARSEHFPRRALWAADASKQAGRRHQRQTLCRTLPRPQTFLIHTGVSSEKCQPVATHSLQPPQGQFQGRNCFGLGFGSENKHSGFYRFTRVGCCFPFQQSLHQAFHSEASGL